jgi:hypothetical protein
MKDKKKPKTQKEILIENAEEVLEMLRQAKSWEVPYPCNSIICT